MTSKEFSWQTATEDEKQVVISLLRINVNKNIIAWSSNDSISQDWASKPYKQLDLAMERLRFPQLKLKEGTNAQELLLKSLKFGLACSFPKSTVFSIVAALLGKQFNYTKILKLVNDSHLWKSSTWWNSLNINCKD